MIDREHDLPITKQAEVLQVSRGSVYYLPRPVPDADLAIMRRLDRLHLEFPFAGSRMLRGLLALQGVKIGRRHVKTLMRRMGIEALYRRPRTTKPEPGHKIYPYLLRGMEITRPNQVWAMDITYIPMERGFVYLAVVLDWASRRVSVMAAVDHDGSGLLRRDFWRMPWPVTASRKSSTPIRARSSPARPSPACSPEMGSPSAWTARALGATTCSSNGCGAASNTRRYTCEPMKPSARPAPRSDDISTSTIAADRIRALTTPHRIKPNVTIRQFRLTANPATLHLSRRRFCSDNRDQLVSRANDETGPGQNAETQAEVITRFSGAKGDPNANKSRKDRKTNGTRRGRGVRSNAPMAC